jgi:hypothetical protein
MAPIGKTEQMEGVLNMNFRVDEVPYYIIATPCRYNSEVQYKVSINGNDEVIFVFDSDLGRYAATGNDGALVPDNVEMTIAEKLNSHSLKIHDNFK